MRKSTIFFALSMMAASPAVAGPAEDATAVVTSVLDRFNAGDIDAFFKAHQPGALIVDEFTPYVWGGPNSAQRWASDYSKDSEAKGISGGRVDYARPIQASTNGTSAYIVLPTTYRFTQRAKKMAAKGSMTFVMTRVSAEWKIMSWTYAGATPSPE